MIHIAKPYREKSNLVIHQLNEVEEKRTIFALLEKTMIPIELLKKESNKEKRKELIENYKIFASIYNDRIKEGGNDVGILDVDFVQEYIQQVSRPIIKRN